MRRISHMRMIFANPAPVQPESPPTTEQSMDPSPHETDNEPVPRIQRLFDNVWLLLVVGLVVMFVVYTGWGMWEILTMPQATLP